MDSKLVKEALTEAAQTAIAAKLFEWQQALKGNCKAEVTKPKANLLQVSLKDDSGLRFFQVQIRETY